jgi:hypothetical protein
MVWSCFCAFTSNVAIRQWTFTCFKSIESWNFSHNSWDPRKFVLVFSTALPSMVDTNSRKVDERTENWTLYGTLVSIRFVSNRLCLMIVWTTWIVNAFSEWTRMTETVTVWSEDDLNFQISKLTDVDWCENIESCASIFQSIFVCMWMMTWNLMVMRMQEGKVCEICRSHYSTHRNGCDRVGKGCLSTKVFWSFLIPVQTLRLDLHFSICFVYPHLDSQYSLFPSFPSSHSIAARELTAWMLHPSSKTGILHTTETYRSYWMRRDRSRFRLNYLKWSIIIGKYIG